MVDEEGFRGGLVEAEFFFEDEGVVDGEGEGQKVGTNVGDGDEEEASGNGGEVEGLGKGVDPAETAKEPEGEEDSEGGD